MLNYLKSGTSPVAYAVADAVVSDSSAKSVDALLADAIKKLDALSGRMDALETGEKHGTPIKGDAAKKSDDDDDDKKKDSVKKSDDDDDDDKKSDAFPPKKKDDSAKKSDDDDDDKKSDAGGPTGVGRIKDDDKKSDSKKRGDDGELEIKHKGKGELKDDARKRGDDDDDRKDDSRADSLSPALLERLAKLEAIVRPRTDAEHEAFADAQARADAIFNGFGKRAPRPMEGEELVDYRTRLAGQLKPYSKTWNKAKLTRLPIETFEIAEAQIYADAIEAAAHPADLGEGELRSVTSVDQTTGLRTTKFYGNESFIKGLGRPGRRVTKIRTERTA